MKIEIKVQTENLLKDHWFQKIIMTLKGLDCSEYLNGFKSSSLSQKEQKSRINNLQNFIVDILKNKHSSFDWKIEYKVSEKRDSIDIYAEYKNKIIIIELDKWRADQVAKKIVSRTALLIDKNIGFISLCYAGTEKMNKSECIKYFEYGNTIQKKMNNFYAGLIIE